MKLPRPQNKGGEKPEEEPAPWRSAAPYEHLGQDILATIQGRDHRSTKA